MTVNDRPPDRERKLTQLGDHLQNVLVAVRRVRGRESHERDGLSFAQWRMLHRLVGEDDVTTVDVARAAELTPATVTGMLDQLVAAGLVRRLRSDVDRRAVLNSLTPAGRAAWKAKQRELHDVWEQALAELSNEELDAGIRVLERLRVYFEEI